MSNRLIYSNDGDGDALDVEDFPGELSGDTVRYGYDNNGNMNRDAYKGINSISYNDNNLPELIDFGSDNKISYFYDASGEKMLRAVSREGSNPEITSYYGLYVHQGIQGGVSSLKYIITPEGRIVNSGSDTSPVWSWEYNLKDHLGNVRSVITLGAVSGSSRVLQQTHYYPYGMRMSQISTTTGRGNDYLFGGKQYQEDFGLNWYDFGARFYDPDLGRFTTVDPLTEKYPGLSPYMYAGNNPVIFIDPDGQEINVTFKGEGAEELYKKIINQILIKQFEVSLTAVKGKENTFQVGLTATKGGGDINKLSEGAQSFYKNFNKVIESETVVNLDVFNGSNEVVIGNYKNNSIDVADMNQFPDFNNNLSEQPSATKQGKMIHETREQFFKALKKQENGSTNFYQDAHLNVIGFENRVNGNTRLNEFLPGRGQGVIEKFKRTNGTVARLQIIGGPNSSSKPTIVVLPYDK